MQQRTLTMDGENPLGVRPIKGLLFSFSIPAIISCLVNSVYNIVDQIFIGQGVGYLGNAATTIAFPLMTIIMAFATLIGSGGSAYAALRLGEGRKREALLTLNNLLVIAIGLGILLAATGLIFLKPILTLFGATETTMPYAIDYTSIVLMGVPFSVISIALSNMARTDGHPRMSMYGILIGAALNTVLAPIYIFVLDWGVKGAAIATITAQFVSMVVLCYYFLRKGNMRFTRRYMKPVGRVWYKIFSLGISSGITSLVACIMQVVMNNSLVYYGNQTEITGDVALSAMGIVMKIAMILASVCIGFGIGAQPILGFNLGAKKYTRVRHTYLLAVSIATGSILIGWAVCQLAPASGAEPVRERKSDIYRLCCTLSADLSGRYFLCRLPDRFHQLLPGNRSAFESFSAFHAPSAHPADSPAADPAFVLRSEWSALCRFLRRHRLCCYCGTVHPAGNAETEPQNRRKPKFTALAA